MRNVGDSQFVTLGHLLTHRQTPKTFQVYSAPLEMAAGTPRVPVLLNIPCLAGRSPTGTGWDILVLVGVRNSEFSPTTNRRLTNKEPQKLMMT